MHKRYFCYISLVLFCLSFFAASYADNHGELYEASVRVTEQAGENKLIAEAFTRVLVKVSGRSDVSSSPSYQDMLKKARGAISQFRYDYKTIVSSEAQGVSEGADPVSEPAREKWFWVRFNSRTVDNLLKQAQLPIWGKIRPETLIWFSQEIKGQRYLQGQYDEPGIYKTFKQQADTRGISLIFPFLDIQDQSSVSTSDIWGNFNDSILLASKRYQAQATVTVRLFKERSVLWVSQWNLLMLGDVQSWELRDENRTRIMAAGIDELADRLARQFTQKSSEGSDSAVLIQINNVSGFKAFQELDDYLRNLATVKAAELRQVERDQVIYNMIYLGDKKAMIQEISLGDVLSTVERTSIDYGEPDTGNEGKDFQPVILDNLEKKETGKLRESEKTLSRQEMNQTVMDNTPSADKNAPLEADTNSETKSAEVSETVPQAPVKVIEQLVPELEYWLAR